MTAPSGEGTAQHPMESEPGPSTHAAKAGGEPPDIEAMRSAADHALGPDDGPEALPPSAAELETLDSTLRGHLELLIPEVARAAGPRACSVQTYCALACVGVARGQLDRTPASTFEARVAHARNLARSLGALCDHYERIYGAAS